MGFLRLPLPLLLLLAVGVVLLLMGSTTTAAESAIWFEHVQKTMDTDAVLRFSGRPANTSTHALTAFRNFTYQQTLDHFNYLPSSYDTFPQRYSIDFSHWGGAGTDSPILLYTGSEQAIEDELGVLGFHKHAAPALKALVVYIEHRYYGLSVPFGSPKAAHKDADSLGYLSASQALADYAEIALHIRETYDARGPIIAIGCSYGGMLSAYFRLKYPHVVHGALSSSGPVLYVNGNVSSRRDFHDIISADFMSISPACFQTIKDSWAEIDRIHSQFGIGELIRIFNPCKPFKSVHTLKSYLTLEYNKYAQYDAPSAIPVRAFCDGVDKAPPGTPILERIKAGLDNFYFGPTCLDIKSARLQAPGIIGFEWQTCTELIFPIGPGGGPQSMFPPAPFSFQAHKSYCKRNYGVEPRAQWMATAYNITHALEQFGSNIIFANGLRDPYSAGGILQDISSSIVALTTKEGSHCLDVLPTRRSDPQWLKDQRAEEMRIIRGWITTFHSSFNPRDDQ